MIAEDSLQLESFGTGGAAVDAVEANHTAGMSLICSSKHYFAG